jgi:hypothetical protein
MAKWSRFAATMLVSGLVLSLGLVATLGLMFVRQFRSQGLSESVEQWGQTGDYFGGVLNPVLAFASLLVVSFTLWLQLRNKADSDRFESLRAFETLLFELLHIHRDILASTDITIDWGKPTQKESKGRDCYRFFLKRVCEQHREHFEAADPTKQSLQDSYSRFYQTAKFEVGHYFRFLYHVFKFIDQSPALSGAEKVNYAKIVRAQLSSAETGLLLFNCLSPEGERFLPLVQKYSLLQGLSPLDIQIPRMSNLILVELVGERAILDPDSDQAAADWPALEEQADPAVVPRQP